MSSHHIVRDEQEPALIVHQLDSFPTDTLHALLEWSPTVVACEPAIDRFTSLGHKLDVVLIGFQNFSFWQEKLSAQQPLKIVTTQNGGFLMTGLTILQRDGHSAVNVITSEDTYPEVVELVMDWIQILDVVVFTPRKRILIVRTETFRKWIPKGTGIKLVCLSGECDWRLDARGQEINSKLEELTFTKQEEGDLIIQSNRPPFLVIEEL
ncbi:hypothetical protein [Marinoscillum sp.]|uniref:hypothetical protein n=1 Tax=Marinoscillum sp. TaxID=2024838 RepID=UPI003BAA8E33